MERDLEVFLFIGWTSMCMISLYLTKACEWSAYVSEFTISHCHSTWYSFSRVLQLISKWSSSVPKDDVLLGILNMFVWMCQLGILMQESWRRRLSKQELAIWEDVAVLKACLECPDKMAAITEVPCHNAYLYRMRVACLVK